METTHQALGNGAHRPAHAARTSSPIREAGLALRETFSASEIATPASAATSGTGHIEAANVKASQASSQADPHDVMRRADTLGSGIGLACAIHCAAAPLLLAAAPAVGVGWLLDPRIEQIVVSIVCVIAGFSAFAHARNGRAYWLSGSMLGLASVLAFSLLGLLPVHSQESLTLACAFGLAGLHLYAARELDRKTLLRPRSSATVAARTCDCPEPCGP